MRYFYMIVVLTCAIFSNMPCDAEETKAKKETAQKTVIVEEGGVGGKHINVGNTEDNSGRSESGVGAERPMPTWETYDQNTGLPDVVPSDSYGEYE